MSKPVQLPSEIKVSAELSREELEYLEGRLGFREDEKLVYWYYLQPPVPGGDPRNCIVLSNLRIFKLENPQYYSVSRADVDSIAHQDGGLLHWDKVLFKLRDGSSETFGIYQKKICTFFETILKEDASKNKVRWQEEAKEEAKRAADELKELAVLKEMKALVAAKKQEEESALAKASEEEREAKKKEQEAQLAAQAEEAKAKDAVLQENVRTSCKALVVDWKKVWQSGSSGSASFSGFWRPLPPDSWGTLGSYIVTEDLDEIKGAKAICVKGDLFPPPKGFVMVWSNKGRGLSFSKDVSVWQPVPPSAEFVAVGHVVVQGFDPPTEELSSHVRVAHKSLVKYDKSGYVALWNDKGMKTKIPGFFHRNNLNLFRMHKSDTLTADDSPTFPHLEHVKFR